LLSISTNFVTVVKYYTIIFDFRLTSITIVNPDPQCRTFRECCRLFQSRCTSSSI